MSLRIAFDLDGTLADLDSALAAITDRLFPPAPAGEPPKSAATNDTSTAETADASEEAAEEQAATPTVRALDRRRQQAIWAEVKRIDNFWETLDETEPGVVARIWQMSCELGWEVLFITQRPSSGGDVTQRQTQRWLMKHGFELPSVYVLGPGASRGKVATALSLDVVVDDRTENCLDVKVDSRARSFLISPNPPANIIANAKRLGIEVVGSVGECLDGLANTGQKKTGFFGWIKEGLGLKA